MFFLKCDVSVVQSVSMHVRGECLHVISIGKSLLSQSSKEKGRKKKSRLHPNPIAAGKREGRGEGAEEQRGGGGGGEDDVICQKDYKECWQNMTADWVLARAFVRAL